MIKVIYNGVDISKSSSIKRCIHEMFSTGHSDTLDLKLYDSNGIWDRWSPKSGDTIRIDHGSISTGTMFITSISPKNGTFDIFAQSAPMSGFVRKNKAWQQVHFLQLFEEIAVRNGLIFEAHSVADQTYAYIAQVDEGDFYFLHKIATQEGCSFLIYDKKLVLYSDAFIEAVKPSERLTISNDGLYKYIDRRSELYGSCIVTSGQFSGHYETENGSNLVLRPQNVTAVGSDADADRYAKNLLINTNKRCLSGYLNSKILTRFAPASVAYLSNSRAPSWDGAVFIEKIRNDYARNLSKIFFRKLEVF